MRESSRLNSHPTYKKKWNLNKNTCVKKRPSSINKNRLPKQVVRSNLAMGKRKRQENDDRHVMYNYKASRSRLKSRKSFINPSTALTKTPKETRLELWMNDAPNIFQLKPAENLAPGNELKSPIWRVLNRLRTGVGRSKSNLLKWRYLEDDLCECGATQTIPHLFECPNSPANILNLDELFISSDGAV